MAARTNLHTNPSAETDATGWLGVNCSVAQSTDYAYVGSNSIKVTYSGTGAPLPYLFVNSITPGTSYTFSCYMRNNEADYNMAAQLVWYNGGAYLGASTGTRIDNVAADTWTRVEVTGVAPANTTRVICYARPDTDNEGAASNISYVDACLMEVSEDAAGTYFDGNSEGAIWTGTANLSTSKFFTVDALESGFARDDNDQLIVTTKTDNATYEVIPGFYTDSEGRLIVTTTTTNAEWDRGFLRLNDALVIEEAAGTYGSIGAGFTTTSSGALAVVNDGTVDWVSGFMRDSDDSLGVTGLA